MFLKLNKGAFDYMVVGLGNPGLQYERTRHNAGFMAIERLAASLNCSISRSKFEALYGECRIADKRVLLLKPQTFMNNSGRSVTTACSFYKIPLDKVIIIFDDVSLDIGSIRLRRKGSAGGHNGIKNIIELCGNEDIMRIKIGVGKKPNPQYDLVNWVLGKIPKESNELFDKSLDIASDAVKGIIINGIDKAMNDYSK